MVTQSITQSSPFVVCVRCGGAVAKPVQRGAQPAGEIHTWEFTDKSETLRVVVPDSVEDWNWLNQNTNKETNEWLSKWINMPVNAPKIQLKIHGGMTWYTKCDMNWYFCFNFPLYLFIFLFIQLFIDFPI